MKYDDSVDIIGGGMYINSLSTINVIDSEFYVGHFYE